MRGGDEHPHAVDANGGDGGEAEAAEEESGVADGHGQREHAHADVALEQVHDALQAGDRVLGLPLRVQQEGFWGHGGAVKAGGRLLGGISVDFVGRENKWP